MPNDSIQKIIGVALGVCVVCSVLVSTASVFLKPIQVFNKALDKKKNILVAAGVEDAKDVDKLFDEMIETKIIDLASGQEVGEDAGIDPETFDERRAAKDRELGVAIPKKKDIGGIRRKSKYQSVYFTKGGQGERRIILPMHGNGLWSTMYGFLALDAADLNTIKSFAFYEHGETPGLGGEVDNPDWKVSWLQKKAFDDSGKPGIKVVKGEAPEGSTHEVNGLSGATLTARGVERLVLFWLGEEGYGPLLERLREGGDDG